MKTLYLCGAGNSEGVRLALTLNAKEARWERIVLLDDDPFKHGQTKIEVPIIGPFSLLKEADLAHSEVANLVTRTTAKRQAARRKILPYGLSFASLISPGVDLTGVALGRGVTIYQNATLGPEVSVGEASVVFMGAVVGHECCVGDGCVIAANAVLNARVQLETGVYVGANATVLPEVKVGAWATIGAGSAVIQDVPAGATAIGVPAQIVSASDRADPELLQDIEHPLAAPMTSGSSQAELEITIAGIWQEVLNVARVNPQQNFFDAGGNSLSALQLFQKIQRVTRRNISLTDVFRFPTVQSLARHMELQEHSVHSTQAGRDTAKSRRAALEQRRERLQRAA